VPTRLYRRRRHQARKKNGNSAEAYLIAPQHSKEVAEPNATCVNIRQLQRR